MIQNLYYRYFKILKCLVLAMSNLVKYTLSRTHILHVPIRSWAPQNLKCCSFLVLFEDPHAPDVISIEIDTMITKIGSITSPTTN